MKTIIRLIAVLGTFTLSTTAFGLTLAPADCDGTAPDLTCWTSDQNNAEDADMLETITGAAYAAEDLDLLYRSEVGGADSGSFAGDYGTTFSNTATDPTDALIRWLELDSIDCTDGCLFVVKDGNASPNIYVFEVTALMWDGMADVLFDGFWPDCTQAEREAETCTNGAISHVSIWGGGSSKVPEPGTLALLGIGLFGMGLMRRRQTS